MDRDGVTWVVTADAAEARIFEERIRGGALKELGELKMTATDAERRGGRRQHATVHASVGMGRHGAGDREPRREAEQRFLRRVATRLAVSAGRGDFDHLVLMGPPHALGALKLALAPAVAARLQASDPHERKQADTEQLRQHLHAARARAWA